MVKQLKRNTNWCTWKQSWNAASVLDFSSTTPKNSNFQKDIGTKLDKNHCFHCFIPFPRIRTHTQVQECFQCFLPFPRIRTQTQIQECFLIPWYKRLMKKLICPKLTQALSGTDFFRQWKITKLIKNSLRDAFRNRLGWIYI